MHLLVPSLLAASAMLLPGCIQERSGGNNHYNVQEVGEETDDWGCAPAPSGTGSWEDEGGDGLHCNYLRDGTDDWAYTLNSSESACREASWAPYQNDGGYLRYWYDNGNRGCDWVIPW